MVSDGHGTLLFYFSGHGVQKGPASPQYMVLYGGDYSDLDRAGLKVEELNKILSATSARKILLIDACRSGEGEAGDKKGGAGPNDVFREMAAASGTRIMNSTRHPYSSWEDKELAHGRFSYFILKGIQGEAAGPNGLVTFDSLFRFVKRGVEQESAKTRARCRRFTREGTLTGTFTSPGTGNRLMFHPNKRATRQVSLQ